MAGRSIKLFLVDDSPTGVITAEIGQWTGKATLAPRQQLDHLARRPEADRPGVYVLSGADPQHEDKMRIYIGEAESVFARIRSHEKNKDFWTRVCLFTSSDEQLTKAHVKYLESRLVAIANEAGRAIVENGNAPQPPALPEADVADMETFVEQVQILLPVLGFTFAQPTASRRPAQEHAGPLFEIQSVGVHAIAQETQDEFVVQTGSTARVEGTSSWDTYKPLRDRLVRDGVLRLTEDADKYVFTEDYAFNSPSAAASVVRAMNSNGRAEWKVNGTRTTYADWQEEKLQAAASDREFAKQH